MTEPLINPDSSSRGWPIFFAVALGLVYIIAVAKFVPSLHDEMLKVWAAFPIAQFLYVGPMAFWCRSQRRTRAMQGWLIGAAAAAIVYAPCWGIALATFNMKF